MTVADTAARLGAVGPYFALSTGPRQDTEGFRPLTDLYTDGDTLIRYAEVVGERMGTDQIRVAASTLHIGTAARLWSVTAGAAALTGKVPVLPPERLHWRVPPSGPVELWWPEPTEPSGLPSTSAGPGGSVEAGSLADALFESVFVRHLLPLEDALRRHLGLSPKVMLGNAASALVGTVQTLLREIPDAAHPPGPVLLALLSTHPLTAAGTFVGRPPAYRRRSCCLYYRLPGAGFCGDCVVPPGRRRGAAADGEAPDPR